MHLKCKKKLKLLFIAILLMFSTSDAISFFGKFFDQYADPEGIAICEEFNEKRSKLLGHGDNIDAAIKTATEELLKLSVNNQLAWDRGYKELDIISPSTAETLPFINCGKIEGPYIYHPYQAGIDYWREQLKAFNEQKSQNIFEIASQPEKLISDLEKSVSKNYCALKIGIVMLCLSLFMEAKNLDSAIFSPKLLLLIMVPYDFFCAYLFVAGFAGAIVNNRLLRWAKNIRKKQD